MANQQRAEEVMREVYNQPHLSPMHHCEILTQALADAGLLMPDLPEPVKNYESVFRVASPLLDCRSVQAVGGQVAIHGHKSRHAPIEEARRFAYALLAAAKLAEEQE